MTTLPSISGDRLDVRVSDAERTAVTDRLDVRVSDAERTAVTNRLAAHDAAGRLSIVAGHPVPPVFLLVLLVWRRFA